MHLGNEEAELRALLQNVSLISELDLSLDGNLYEQSSVISRMLIEQKNYDQLSHNFPAVYTVFLVAEGVHCYEGGSFWPNLSVKSVLTPAETQQLGRQFLLSLNKLGLETFDYLHSEDHAHKYVTPILLHGGIPRYCSGDLWRLLLREINLGFDGAEQILANWRNNLELLYLDKPAKRFVSSGREFVTDLIQRMIDFVEATDVREEMGTTSGNASALSIEFGIPTYLIETFFAQDHNLTTSVTRLPKPVITINRFSSEGPVVRLPAIPHLGTTGTWEIKGFGIPKVRTSSYEEREIPLQKSPHWEVLLQSLGQTRKFIFSCLEKAQVYFFKPTTGELLSDHSKIQEDTVFALCPKHITISRDREGFCPLREIEQLPPLVGTWSDWYLRHFDLSEVDRIYITSTSFTGIRVEPLEVPVKSRVARPSLSNSLIEYVTESEGRQIFADLPVLILDPGHFALSNWRVRFGSHRQWDEVSLADLKCSGSRFDLSPLVPAGRFIVGDLSVRGPLGSDLKVRLVIIPGLEISLPQRVLGPHEEVSIKVQANDVWINGILGQVDIDFESGKDSKQIEVSDGVSTVEVFVRVPRILWLVRWKKFRPAAFGSICEVIGLDEFQLGEVEALQILAGRPEEMVQLRLMGAGESLQSTCRQLSAGPRGNWSFPLQSFADSIAGSGLARLTFQLDVGDFHFEPIVVEAHYDAKLTEFEAVVDENQGFTCCEMTWTENRRFHDRVLRLWSLQRPWEPEIEIIINDEAAGKSFFTLPYALIPGWYLAQIVLRDSWASSKRPGVKSNGVLKVCIGDFGTQLTRCSLLDPNIPVEAIELLLSGHGNRWSVSPDHLAEVVSHIGLGMLSKLDEIGITALNDSSFVSLKELVMQSPEELTRWIIRQLEDGLDDKEINGLILSVLPDLIDIPPECLDENELERAWFLSPILGSAIDPYRIGNTECGARWAHFTGWNPQMSPKNTELFEAPDGLPHRGGPLDDTWGTFLPDKLDSIIDVLSPDDLGPLRWSGYLRATLGLLRETWQARDKIDRWRSSFALLNDQRVRKEEVYNSYLKVLEPGPNEPGWYRFPQDLLAASFHLVGFAGERLSGTWALWEAMEFAGPLVERNIILAIAIHRLGM